MSEIPTETRSHVMTRSGSSLVFSHSFIFVSFKSSAAFAERKVLPATVVNSLTLVEFSRSAVSHESYSISPFVCSKKEFVKRELCTSRNVAFAGYAERWISSLKCCTYKPLVDSSVQGNTYKSLTK